MEVIGPECYGKSTFLKISETVIEQIVIVGLEMDLRAVLQDTAVLHKLARMGQAVLLVFFSRPRIAEIDIYSVAYFFNSLYRY